MYTRADAKHEINLTGGLVFWTYYHNLLLSQHVIPYLIELRQSLESYPPHKSNSHLKVPPPAMKCISNGQALW